MQEWSFTLRERLTAASRHDFAAYQAFSGFTHINELVTLDSMMCRNLIDELLDQDWDHNIHEDCRVHLFRNADYLLARQPLDRNQHQIIASLESPDGKETIPDQFERCGYDIMDAFVAISVLTNCGQIPEAFNPAQTNKYGLLDDFQTASAVCSKLRALQPDDPHLGKCEVWSLARRLPAATAG